MTPEKPSAMKRLGLMLCYILTTAIWSQAQNVGINATGATPDASAMLDIASTNTGLLIPRVALTATNAAGPITTPATSLLVYNTATAGTAPNNVVPGYYFWNGTAWIQLLTPSNASNVAWSLTGNAGTNAATNFIGTTDDRAMVYKSNNQSFLEMGSRSTLGLVQGFTDYTDGTEKVSHLRSSLQFEAAGAQFYKPKFFTDANGNFRMKGSAAGTDFYEFGSAGTDNAGQFEFIVGDDGDEPILFKSNNYLTGTTEIMRLQSGRAAIGSTTFDGTNPEKLLVNAGTTTSVNAISGKGTIDNYLQLNIQNQSAGTSASSDIVATADNGSETTNFVDLGINSSAYTGGVMGAANDAYLYNIGQNLLIGTGTAAKSLILMTGGTAQATNERMRIDGNGNVGVATTAPTAKLDVAGTFKLGSAGTVMNGMFRTTITINDNTTFNYTVTRTLTATVTGATTNATVILNPRSALPTGIGVAWSRISANNTLTIGFTNADATARAIGNVTFDVTIIR